MTKINRDHQLDWPALLQRINHELAMLDAVERAWLKDRLAVIAATQKVLDELFGKAGGNESCAGCNGACCACGRHHITLTNLMAYLLEGEDPPVPNFNSTCPFLGPSGCRLTVARRPYNCITFFCETLEDRLDPVECEQLRSLDRKLRNEYERVAARYPAASLRGLWIALERVGGGQLLRSATKVMIE
jgi:hypothetical protein